MSICLYKRLKLSYFLPKLVWYGYHLGLEILPWTKILTLIIWPKSEVSGPWNINHEAMALVYSCWSHRDTLIGLEILPWIQTLTMMIWPKSSQWTVKSRSWLLYIPAGLIEIHPHMKHQLATINRSWDSTLDTNLNHDNLAKFQSVDREI